MKKLPKLLFGAVIIASTYSLQAATPVVTSVQATAVAVGEVTTLRATVSDSDSDLDYVLFQVAGPGISGWHNAGTADTSGGSANAELSWSPPASGLYTVNAIVYDLSGSASAQKTFEVFAGRRIVSDLTVSSGINRLIEDAGEILTKENLTGSEVTVQNGGNLILWAGGRVLLKPGFRANTGSFFWAAVDHNMNGYSDVEEVSDTDGDGIPDAYEVDHGLNMLSNADAGQDRDGDGLTNLQEYQQNRNIDQPDNPNLILVMFSPSR